MKSLTQIQEAKSKIQFDVKKDSINYIGEADLKKYLEIADNFISPEAKDIINWLIVNNDTYIAELSNDLDENALAGFYKAGVPSKENLKELYKLLGTLIKDGRYLEIPVFQSKEDFEAILNKKKSLDTVILDLDTEKGRTAVTKKYEPLVHKIAKQWLGKINLSYNELVSCCYEGLTYAMNTYGKKNKKSNATDEAVASYTFGQYAAYCMRNHVAGWGVADSHLVRIPTSQQKKERDQKGHNTKNISVSGDKAVGHDDEGGKTMFDFMGSTSDTGKNLDNEDLEKIWNRIYKVLEEEFDSKILDVWYSFYGLRGHKKMKNKEIADKYNVANSNITYYCFKINSFIKKNKKILSLFSDAYELMKECLNEADRESNDMQAVRHQENIELEDV